MNLAFVVLTSALLGNHPAAAPCNTCSTPAPAATCDSCGPTCGHSWKFKLNLFPCNTCKAAEPACAAPAPVCAPACEVPKCGHCGHGGGFLTKFKGLFKGHGHSTCDTCATPAPACEGCSAPAAVAAPTGCAPAAVAPAAPGGQATEPIKEAPKKMPVEAPKADPKAAPPKTDAPKTDAPKGDKATRINDIEPAPFAIPAVPTVTNANPVANTSQPAVIVAPATIRNPF